MPVFVQGELFGVTESAKQRRDREQDRTIRAPFDQHLCILAGPGAGKTHVMVSRIEHMLASGISADDIVVITYTNSAKTELVDRLGKKSFVRPMPFVGTIHQYCFQLLKSYNHLLGLSARIRIVEPHTTERLFVRWCGTQGTYAELALAWERFSGEGQMPVSDLNLWQKLDAKLKQHGLATFTCLQLWVLDLLEQTQVEVPVAVLVDEYQDTSGLQVRLLQALAKQGSWITVVGDPEQSIFGFAGADSRQLQEFAKRFTPCCTRVLAANARSQKNLVIAANRLRIDKHLQQFALHDADEQANLVYLGSAEQQAQYLRDQISILIEQKGCSPSQIAVLFRESQSAAAIVQALELANFAVWLPRYDRFESKPHLQNMILSLEAMLLPDDEITQYLFFDQVLRGSQKTWAAVLECARDGLNLEEAARLALSALSRPRQATLMVYLNSCAQLAAIRELPTLQQQIQQVYERILTPRFGLREQQMAQMIQSDVKKMSLTAAASQNLDELCDWLRQGLDLGVTIEEKVTVASLHFAKGREWDAVFLADLTRGVLPHRLATDPGEERRLLHVGASRARKYLYLCAVERIPGRGEGFCPFLSSLRGACRLRDLR